MATPTADIVVRRQEIEPQPHYINVSELQEIVHEILERVKLTTPNEIVEIDADYYWIIFTDDLFDMTIKHHKPVIGQISETIEQIRNTVQDEYFPPGFPLEWTAQLLRTVAAALLGNSQIMSPEERRDSQQHES